MNIGNTTGGRRMNLLDKSFRFIASVYDFTGAVFHKIFASPEKVLYAAGLVLIFHFGVLLVLRLFWKLYYVFKGSK